MKKLLSAGAFLLLSTMIVAAVRPGATEVAAQGATVQQPGQQDEETLEARIAVLEADLAAEKQRNEATRALLDQTVVYLEKQAKAATALLAVLDLAQQQGFAVGENWASRETLLTGWRAYWGDQQQGVPKLPAPPKATPPARPPRR